MIANLKIYGVPLLYQLLFQVNFTDMVPAIKEYLFMLCRENDKQTQQKNSKKYGLQKIKQDYIKYLVRNNFLDLVIWKDFPKGDI